MGSQKVLYDVMKHQEWIPPHSEQWYKQLGTEIGEYNYLGNPNLLNQRQR
ncbi:hypothetical protein [Bacillus sp. SD088]|nr:hypothetical protein [Bacillus sp. SD088]MBO0992770.1 hypothetical protein [Bacillus sp. SD088]